MPSDGETCDDSLRMPGPATPPEPGIVVLFAAGHAATHAFAVERTIDIGRALPAGVLEDDDRVSRRHVRVSREGESWHVEDLDSRNGTLVNGRPLEKPAAFLSPVLIRIGRSLLWPVPDVRPFLGQTTAAPAEGPVVGAGLRRVLGEIALAARAGDNLCVLGESGAGKEIAAHAFHEARHGARSDAPFVAVNCAAIPEGLAERLLFGARRGAYSGATADAEGYVQAADGGTLFLDEIAELDPLVQAKLLRVLESREVLPLGSSRPRRVEVGVCAASHRGLRDEVAAGRFREDLYFRVGRPEVRVPPLRERLDEIPALVARGLQNANGTLAASAAFIEVCALRHWPGNVRELLREVQRAAQVALLQGSRLVEPEHLQAGAGERLAAAQLDAPVEPEREDALPSRWSDDEIRRTLAEYDGNVRGTARALGMHRSRLRRWLDKQKSR